MFTGLVSACAPVLKAESVGDSLRIRVANPYGKLTSGESIAVSGVCLTVEAFDDQEMSFFVSPETLRRTTLAHRTFVNLERALLASDRLGGHVVQGHVDGMAEIVAIQNQDPVWRLEVRVPRALSKYCVAKGSICLDGISLTINEILDRNESGDRLWIQIIPHTWNHTHLHTLKVGEKMNLEVDLFAKYVERLCQPYSKP